MFFAAAKQTKGANGYHPSRALRNCQRAYHLFNIGREKDASLSLQPKNRRAGTLGIARLPIVDFPLFPCDVAIEVGNITASRQAAA